MTDLPSETVQSCVYLADERAIILLHRGREIEALPGRQLEFVL